MAVILKVRILASLPLLFFLITVPFTSGLITSHEIVRTNRRWISLGSFGFEKGGCVEVNASKLVIYSPEQAVPPDTQSMGFLVAGKEDSEWIQEQQEQPDDGLHPRPQKVSDEAAVCPLTSPNITRVFRILDMGPPGPGGEHLPKLAAVTIPSPGLYTLYFINCVGTRLVSAAVEVKMWNVGPDDVRQYLPSGEFYLVIVDVVLAGLYGIMMVLWLSHAARVWCHTVGPPAYQVLLTVLLPFLSALYAVIGAGLFVRQASGLSPTLDWAQDFLLLASAALLLGAFLLGLEQVDPYLTDVERAVLYIAIPTWIPCQAALAMSENNALLPLILSPDSVFWAPTIEQLQGAILFSLAILTLLLCFEFLALFCSVILRRGGSRPRDDREEEAPLSKYYVNMSLCMVTTSALAFVLQHYAPFSLAWLSDAICQVVAFMFISWTLYRIRPRLEKSVYQLFDESDAVEEELAEL